MKTEELRKKDVTKYSKLASFIISDSPYYSDWAKKSEIKQFYPETTQSNLNDEYKKYIVAKNKDEVIGFIYGIIDEGGIFSLIWMGVDKNYQGKGVGKLLISYLIKNLKKHKIHKITLTIRPNNKNSFYLFKNEGFKEQTLLKRHWYELDFYSYYKFIE